MMENKDINNVNGLDRAITKAKGVRTTITIKPWYASALKRELGSNHTFRNLNIIKVNRASQRAVNVTATFNTDIGNNCYSCGLVLETEISRASGIGPTCAKNWGVPRASKDDAPAIIEHMNKLAAKYGEFTVWIPKSQIKEGLQDVLDMVPEWKPKKETPKGVHSGQVQIAGWFAQKEQLPEVFNVQRIVAETPKWLLFETPMGTKIGVPKSLIVENRFQEKK